MATFFKENRLEYILSQVCVILSVICLAITYTTRNKKVILLFVCLEAVFYGLQYVFLHEYAGAVLNITGFVRGVWFYIDEKRGKQSNMVSLIVNSIVIITIGFITYASWIDCIAVLGTWIFAYAIWQPSVLGYRWICAFGSLFWLSYNILCFSVLGIALEVILFIIELYGAIKLLVEKKKKVNCVKN